eukprot:7382734-Prymnesium_polylepis.2
MCRSRKGCKQHRHSHQCKSRASTRGMRRRCCYRGSGKPCPVDMRCRMCCLSDLQSGCRCLRHMALAARGARGAAGRAQRLAERANRTRDTRRGSSWLVVEGPGAAENAAVLRCAVDRRVEAARGTVWGERARNQSRERCVGVLRTIRRGSIYTRVELGLPGCGRHRSLAAPVALWACTRAESVCQVVSRAKHTGGALVEAAGEVGTEPPRRCHPHAEGTTPWDVVMSENGTLAYPLVTEANVDQMASLCRRFDGVQRISLNAGGIRAKRHVDQV